MNNLTKINTPDLSFTGGGGSNFLEWLTDKIFPVGTYFSTESTFNPNSTFAGEWSELPQGTFLMAVGSGGTAGQKGGSADAVVVKHNHTIVTLLNTGNGVQSEDLTIIYPQGYNSRQISYYNKNQPVYAEDTGVDGTGKNLPPYITAHIWKRTK